MAWSAKIVGAVGGRLVVKIALPTASAYSLIESMRFRMRYGMDRLEITPMTKASILSSVASGSGAGGRAPAGSREAPPPATPVESEKEKPTEDMDHDDITTAPYREKDSETEASDTSTDTIVQNRSIDDEEADMLLGPFDTETQETDQATAATNMNDDLIQQQNEC